MRLLNKDEQDFCKRILEGDGEDNYLGNIIDNQLLGVRISLTRDPQNVDLLFTIQNAQPTNEEIEMTLARIKEISVLILNAVNLINLLEKENYIMLLQRATTIPNQSMFGQGFDNHSFITNNFSDPTISKLLIDFVDKEIFVTEEFRQFCKKKYIARDEQRFRRQICITTTALIVATVALLTNTFYNLLPKFTGGTKIKQEQVDTLVTGLKSIESKLDTINITTKGIHIREVKGITKTDSSSTKVSKPAQQQTK